MKKWLLAFLALITHTNVIAGVFIEQWGDSTTAGLSFYSGKVQPAAKSSVDVIYLSINSRFGPVVTIANKGISGSCAFELLTGKRNAPEWRRIVRKSGANIITFGYGLNDHVSCHRSPDQYAEDLRGLVDLTLAAGKMPVLIEPTPSTAPNRKDLAEYVGAMNLVAEQRKIPIVQHYKLWTSMSNWESLLSDGIHPTEQGYRIKGLTEYQVLVPMIIAALRQQPGNRHR